MLAEGRESNEQVAQQADDHGDKELLVAHHLAAIGGEEGVAAARIALLDEGDDILASGLAEQGQVALESVFLQPADVLHLRIVAEANLPVVGHAVQAVGRQHGHNAQVAVALEGEHSIGNVAGFVDLDIKDVAALSNAGDDLSYGLSAGLDKQAHVGMAYGGIGPVEANAHQRGLVGLLTSGGIGHQMGAAAGVALAGEAHYRAVALLAVNGLHALGYLVEDELVRVAVAQLLVQTGYRATAVQERQHEPQLGPGGQRVVVGHAETHLHEAVATPHVPRTQVQLLHRQFPFGKYIY